jgi:hypothetical protein
MMGKASRDKGGRRERQVVTLLRGLGLPARRVPLSGASEGFKGDVQFNLPDDSHTVHRHAEVKGRKAGAGFKTVLNWLGENDALFLIADRKEPVVVLPWDIFKELVEATKE